MGVSLLPEGRGCRQSDTCVLIDEARGQEQGPHLCFPGTCLREKGRFLQLILRVGRRRGPAGHRGTAHHVGMGRRSQGPVITEHRWPCGLGWGLHASAHPSGLSSALGPPWEGHKDLQEPLKLQECGAGTSPAPSVPLQPPRGSQPLRCHLAWGYRGTHSLL